jgi:hypothetical protein
MPDYRQHKRDAKGRIVERLDLVCPDDAGAIKLAQTIENSHSLDL